MTDLIVERLREETNPPGRVYSLIRTEYVREAADEIERLRAWNYRLLQRADAALSALQRDGWQPIETAPKNRGKHLQMFGDGPGIRQCQFIGCWWDDEHGGVWQETYSLQSVSPTHWKPLDPPPAPLVADK